MATVVIDNEKNRMVLTPAGYAERSVILKLPARRWMQKAGVFIAPMTRLNAQMLLDNNILIPSDARQALRALVERTEIQRAFPHWYTHKLSPTENQREALAKIYGQHCGALFIDRKSTV